MNSPFAQLYTALIAHIQASMPTIRYISQDLGQLEYYADKPPVSWPCVLIDVGDALYTDASHAMQIATATITLRLAHTSYSEVSNLTQQAIQELGLKHYELEHTLCSILHSWQPPHAGIGKLVRTAVATEKRDDNIRVRQISFTCQLQYASNYNPAIATPALQTIPNNL